MRILILGGTWSLGRLVAEESCRRGFDVTVFNRGLGTVVLPAGLRHVCGDRRSAASLQTLAGLGPWDAVVDISGKVPAMVGRSARALVDVADRYISISANLVYRDWPHVPVDEISPVRDCDPEFDPGDWAFEPELYGAMKAGCENACRAVFGIDRTLVLRLHEIIGQYEDDGPLLWWLQRMRRGGAVLVPAPDRAIQPIDVRDVAAFVVDLARREVNGVMNVAAPPGDRTYGNLVRSCAQVVAGAARASPELVWADQDWLAEQGVRQWTDLPLWRHAPAPWDMSVERAAGAGLTCRPLIDTVADTWRRFCADGRGAQSRRSSGFGLDPEREADLVTRWRRSGN